jgi:hypothetical protein
MVSPRKSWGEKIALHSTTSAAPVASAAPRLLTASWERPARRAFSIFTNERPRSSAIVIPAASASSSVSAPHDSPRRKKLSSPWPVAASSKVEPQQRRLRRLLDERLEPRAGLGARFEEEREHRGVAGRKLRRVAGPSPGSSRSQRVRHVVVVRASTRGGPRAVLLHLRRA